MSLYRYSRVKAGMCGKHKNARVRAFHSHFRRGAPCNRRTHDTTPAKQHKVLFGSINLTRETLRGVSNVHPQQVLGFDWDLCPTQHLDMKEEENITQHVSAVGRIWSRTTSMQCNKHERDTHNIMKIPHLFNGNIHSRQGSTVRKRHHQHLILFAVGSHRSPPDRRHHLAVPLGVVENFYLVR